MTTAVPTTPAVTTPAPGDKKLTELAEIEDATYDDLVYLVNTPGGTPQSRAIALGNLLKVLTTMPNEIINPEFAIWQESGGAAITAASTPANDNDTYFCDQWILLSNGDDIADLSRETAGPPRGSKYNLKVEIETANAKVGIFQPIENLDSIKFEGGKASLSFMLRGDVDNIRAAVISWSGAADAITSDIINAWAAEGTNPTLAANWTFENTPVNIVPIGPWVRHKIEGIDIDTASMANLGVFIWLDDVDASIGEYFELGQIKLEFNVKTTKFIARKFADEVRACQRFFSKSYELDTAVGTGAAKGSVAHILPKNLPDADDFHVFVRHPVELRIDPDSTVYGHTSGTIDKAEVNAVDRTCTTIGNSAVGMYLFRNSSGVQWNDQERVKVHWTSDARL